MSMLSNEKINFKSLEEKTFKEMMKLGGGIIQDELRKIMRNRTIGINVRVSENEKKKLQRNAKKSKLSLSGYLRKSGLQQKIYEVPDEKIYKIYTGITDLKYQFPYLSNEEVREKIEKMQSDFLDVYNNKEDGDKDGNNENMGN